VVKRVYVRRFGILLLLRDGKILLISGCNQDIGLLIQNTFHENLIFKADSKSENLF